MTRIRRHHESSLPFAQPRGASLKQLAAYLNLSEATVTKLERTGLLPPPMRLGAKGKKIFDLRAVDARLDEQSGLKAQASLSPADDLDRELAEFVDGQD